MTDQNTPNPDQPEFPATADHVPTEALQLADQQPVTVDPSDQPRGQEPRTNHTRTVLEVVGGVVAVGMILVAGAVGFVVGHATSDGDVRMDRAVQQWDNGPEAGGPGMGQGQRGQGPGERGPQGFGQGDRREQGEGERGFGGRHHDGQGQDEQRFGPGVDPHGDNWSGQGHGQGGPGMGTHDGQDDSPPTG